MSKLTSTAPKPFTGLAELINRQAAAANGPDNVAAAVSDDEEDHPVAKRLCVEPPASPDYIPPFTSGAIGEKYVVIKGVKPGIYSDWYELAYSVNSPLLTYATGGFTRPRFIKSLGPTHENSAALMTLGTTMTSNVKRANLRY
jgi:hypothetical protein